ncbi:hypothetical protein CGZ80_27235 [Rhodopirellula sp. MGV]|nr:hypothetical protein CGZ80_27235 [Rhodopirellula sp. MGV]
MRRTAIVALLLFTSLITASGFLVPNRAGRSQSVSAKAEPATAAKVAATTKPIEQLRVGDRVLAHNLQVSQDEREAWIEPSWGDWIKLSLVMPKDDGSELRIEMLRPEPWVLDQVQFLATDASDIQAISPLSLDGLNRAESQVPFSPLRPLYRKLAISNADARANGFELTALLVEMDLPELAIEGPALVNEITPCVSVAAGTGQVATATFHHTSGDVIDLLIGDGSIQSSSARRAITRSGPSTARTTSRPGS